MTEPLRRIDDELDRLEELVPLADQRLLELGCGAAQLARAVLARHVGAKLTGLEVDQRQLAKNLAVPSPRLDFVQAGAQAIPLPDAAVDGVLMLKSLHHVPMPLMAQALRAGPWTAAAEVRFDTAAHFTDFADFERRLMRPTFADHRIDDALLAAVRERFLPHLGPQGAHFTRQMHVRVLRRRG